MDIYSVINETLPRKPVIVQFSASWCPPCQKLKAAIAELMEQNSSFEYIYVDIDEDDNEISARDANVKALPQTHVLCNELHKDLKLTLWSDPIKGFDITEVGEALLRAIKTY